jgi:hypothetical protein
MIVIIKFDLIDLIFIYVIIGLAHHILITVIKHIMTKKVNQDMKDIVERPYKFMILEIILWPVSFIKRMIRYVEMEQTLKFVEDKLEAFYDEDNKELE